MAQASISQYFAPKKRGYDEDLVVNKKKVICLERFDDSEEISKDANENSTRVVHPSSSLGSKNGPTGAKVKRQASIDAVRQVITPQRTRSSRQNQVQNVEGIEVPKIVNFYIGGSLSPKKKPSQRQAVETVTSTTVKSALKKISKPRDNHSITKDASLAANSEKSTIEKTLLRLNNGANDEELKKKLRKAEVLTKVNKLKDGLEKLTQMREKRLASNKAAVTVTSKQTESEVKSLKAFKKIELEILR